MNLFDTHAHFSCDAEKTAATLVRASQAGVAQLMAVGGSPELNRAAMLAYETVRDATPTVRLALGLDRDQATPAGGSCPRYDFAPIIDNRTKLSAVGEIGLDFHYAPETAKAQCDLFAAQLELARELNLPVVIHTRDADDATLGVLDENDFHTGIIHCFNLQIGTMGEDIIVPDQINKLLYSEEEQILFAACENKGVYCIDFSSGEPSITLAGNLNNQSQLVDLMIDYQGNLWVASH